MQTVIRFSVGDLVKMKKIHPCGCAVFRILRVGSDIRVACTQCLREVTLDRLKFEKSGKNVLPKPSEDSNHG